MDPIEILADAIQSYEGWHAGSRSYRNRNPGNLRLSSTNQAVDGHGYRVFDSLLEGYSALLNDLLAKFRGSHGLTPQSTLLDLMNVYAPAEDSNQPRKYAAFVAQWLTNVYRQVVRPESTLDYILKLGKPPITA